MKKIFLAILCLIFAIALSACTETGEASNETTVEEHQTVVEGSYVSSMTAVPSSFSALEGMDKLYEDVMEAKKTTDFAKNLRGFEHYYIPTYADQWCEPMSLVVYGPGGSVVLLYRIKDAPEDSGEWALTLQFERGDSDGGGGHVRLQNRISGRELSPLESCEGIYYKDVYNPGDNGELSLTTFCWVYDGYCFLMQVFPEVMEQIRENDPDALNGALFELEKVELE